MTDETLPDDELVSAYLDGEATPAEIAAVEQDPALMARVEQLRAVRDAVAAPVPAASTEQRDLAIGAALAVAADAAVPRPEARIVPGWRRRETLLAVAAAAVLLAAVVSAGLIATRGGDDVAQMAVETSAPFDEAAPAAEAAPADTDMATDDSADYDMATEEFMAADEPMAEADMPMAEEAMADDAMAEAEFMAESDDYDMAAEAEVAAGDAADDAAIGDVEAPAAEAEAESAVDAADEDAAESAVEAPHADALDPGAVADDASAADAAVTDDGAEPIVDLGAVDDLESLFEDLAAIWSAALEDGATAAGGACSAAVNERAAAADLDTRHSFMATVGVEDPLAVDGLFARGADGASVIVYAARPDCEVLVREADQPDGS